MINKIKSLYDKYREIISYLFWGVMTTVVNWAVFFAFSALDPLKGLIDPRYTDLIYNVMAWIAAVLFAFFTNRVFVFRSEKRGFRAVALELAAFSAARLTSLGCEEVILLVFVSILGWNTAAVKIAASVVVVILNYVFSKLFVFRKDKKTGENNDSDPDVQ